MVSFPIFWLVFFTAVSVGKAENIAHDGIKTLPNYGVIFKDEGSLYPSADQWTHYFELNLPQFPFVQEKPVACKHCPWYEEAMIEIVNLHRQNRVQVGTIMSKIKNLLPHHNFNHGMNRKRRSFLPFIGSLAKTLFGTSTTADLNQLSRNVAMIRANQQKMAQAISKQIGTFTAAVRNFDVRLTNTFDAITDNHNAIQMLGADFNMSLISAEVAQARLVAAMTKQTRLSLKVLNKYEELLMGVIDTLQGKLSPLLLSEHVLTNVLSYINERLQTHSFFLSHSHPAFYYRHAKFVIFRQFSSIFIAVHFPVSTIHTRLYSVASFPIPLNSTSKHGTELVTDKDYFILSSDKRYYAEVTNADLNSCVHDNHVWHCEQQLIFRNDSQNSCFWSLFYSDIRAIDKNCVFHFKQDVISPKVINMNSSHSLLINISNFDIECEHSSKNYQGCSFCIVSVPCKCSLSTESLFIPKHLSGCHRNQTKAITMIHAVNLILIQQFFNSSLDNLTPNSAFLKPLDIKVPHFQLFTHNFSNFVAKEQKASLDIKKISENARQNRVIFQTLSEAMLDNEAKLVPSFNFGTVFTIISTSIAVLSLLAFVFLFRQYHKLTAIVTVLHSAHKAHSLPIFHYTTPHVFTTTEVPFTIPTEHLYSTSEVLGTFSVIILVFYLVYRYVKSEQFQLILELSNDQSIVLIPIRKIPYAHHLLLFSSANPLEDFRVRFGLRSYLYVNWAGLNVEIIGQSTKWNLPSEIRLDPLLAYRTHRIISTPFNALLYKRIGNIIQPVVVKDLSVSSAPTSQSDSIYPKLADMMT